MDDQERITRALSEALQSAVSAEVRVEGAGVRWSVIVEGGARSCEVHCYWYAPIEGDVLSLGMNRGNQRAAGSTPRRPHQGAEYAVRFHENGERRAGGRTGDLFDVPACVREWLRGATVDALQMQFTFVDAGLRRVHAVTDALRSRLGDAARVEGLCAYGVGRSCEVELGDDALACKFFIGQAQVALAFPLDDVAEAAARWVVDRMSLRELRLAVPATRVERHAEVLEAGQPARWHWLHVRDRMNDPSDVVAPLRPLLELLIERGVATEFYSFTSLNRFCFSASSHYPWVNDGLPFVVRAREEPRYVIIPEGYALDWAEGAEADARRKALFDNRCSAEEAAEQIEAALERSRVRPFFGSAPMLETESVSAELDRRGSALRAETIQQGPWYTTAITAGDRACRVSSGLQHIAFYESDVNHADAWLSNTDDGIALLRRWLEDRCAVADVAVDPRVTRFRVPRFEYYAD